MSSRYRIGAEFYGTDAGFIGTANRVLYGTNRLGQGFRQAGRDAGYMGNQVKAIGTTLRYYLAGRVVFGVTSAIGSLREFKNELGTLNALAGQLDSQGKFHGLGSQLQDLGSDAIQVSNEFGIAVTDIEKYMQRFYSAFELSGTQQQNMAAAKKWAEDIAGLAVTLGSEAGDPDALGGGIAGFINAIPGGTNDIGGNTDRIANLIAFLTQKTPNITGRNISNDIGRIGSTMGLTDMTPEQAFAVWTSAGKSGGSAQVIGRGITQLMAASLLHPQSPAQKAAFEAATGTSDPSKLRTMGGFEVLKKLLDYVGGSYDIGKPKDLAGFNTEEDLNTALSDSALNKGGLTKLYDLFGRQESVRQFINLLGQGGSKALDDFIKGIGEATDADLNAQRIRAAQSQRGLQQFQTSMSNLNLSLVRGLEFPLETLGKGIKFLSDQAAAHRTATSVAVGSAATLYATRLLGRFGAFNSLQRRVNTAEEIAGGVGGLNKSTRLARGFLRLAQGASTVERSAVEGALVAEASPNVIGGGIADGSRSNPLWVIIHPYSNYVGVGGGYPGNQGGGGGGGTTIIPTGLPGKAGRLGKFGKYAKFAPLAAAGPYALAAVAEHQLGIDTWLGKKLLPDDWSGKDKGYAAFGHDVRRPFQAIHDTGRSALHKLFGGGGGGDNANDPFWKQVQSAKAAQPYDWTGKHPITVKGKFDPLHVKATIVDSKGRKVAEAEGQAPVQLWGPQSFPSSQGKPGTRTGGTN